MIEPHGLVHLAQAPLHSLIDHPMTAITYMPVSSVARVGVIGMGSVGAGWTSLFLARGISVKAFDPGPGAEARARQFVESAWPALKQLGIATQESPPQKLLSFCATAAEAASDVDLVQENVFEKPALKASVLREIGDAAPGRIIMSSTGGIPPSQLQASCPQPERFVVVHPFNPPHLIPLVEVVGGRQTAPEVIDWAMEFARWMGKVPIRLNAEAVGHMTNRLQFALVREAVACLVEGMASAQDIDAAVRYGLAPRWAFMGSLLTLHLAGGPGGMKGILDHAGPAIEQWWTPLSTPHLDDPEVKARLVEAGTEVSAGAAIQEWTAWRDEQLVSVLKLQSQSRVNEPALKDPS